MKLEKYVCDACGKETDDTFELTIPILHIGVDDEKYAAPHKIDVCEKCFARFFDLYYQIAAENHSSGIRAIDMEDIR